MDIVIIINNRGEGGWGDIVIIINNRGGWNNRGRLDGVEKMCRRFLSKHNAFFSFSTNGQIFPTQFNTRKLRNDGISEI